MFNFPVPSDSISFAVLYLGFYVALENNFEQLSHASLSLSRDVAYRPIPGDARRLVVPT